MTIIGLLQLREAKLLDLSIEEGLLPLQDLPELLSLEQRMQQDPYLQLKMVSISQGFLYKKTGCTLLLTVLLKLEVIVIKIFSE